MTDHTSIENLPFVTVGPDGMPNLWDVRPTGDWSADCATGRTYGDALVDHMRAIENPSPLAHVAAAMGGARSGIEVGFFSAVASRAL